jgi:hypothetical protein
LRTVITKKGWWSGSRWPWVQVPVTHTHTHTHTHTQINTKWVKCLNLRPKAIKLFEENRKSLHDIEFGGSLLNITSKTTKKEKVYNWTSKLNTFVHWRTLSRKWKDSA